MRLPPEPAWLTAKIDQRIQLMRDSGAFEIASESQPLIFSFLDEGDHEMTPEEFRVWERTCDNCGRYCPPTGDMAFYTGHAGREIEGRQVILAYGVCDDCRPANHEREK